MLVILTTSRVAQNAFTTVAYLDQIGRLVLAGAAAPYGLWADALAEASRPIAYRL